jgi:hypothetical protein
MSGGFVIIVIYELIRKLFLSFCEKLQFGQANIGIIPIQKLKELQILINYQHFTVNKVISIFNLHFRHSGL